MSTDEIALPGGVSVGHWTDSEGLTGCTAILGPPGSVSSGEVRGGGPGTREFELLSPATSTPGAHAFVLSGGSSFGLAAAEGVAAWLAERDTGFQTPAGKVPLVTGAVLYDLMIGDAAARPGPAVGRAACDAAGPEFERGNVGAGTGCTAGKLLGPGRWTKTGLGAATARVGDAVLTAIAAANPFGDVIDADGSVLAGLRGEAGFRRTVDALTEAAPPWPTGESTTLVCLVTDADLSKTEAWTVARSASAGMARALSPAATAVDGDLACCLATGAVPADHFLLSAFAAEVTAAAIRDAARRADSVPEAPAAT